MMIQDGVLELGLNLASPRNADERGGSVMVALPSTKPSPDVLECFRLEDIYADARGQILRLSPGILTTEAGVKHMLRVLRSVVA
jgi:kynureninase